MNELLLEALSELTELTYFIKGSVEGVDAAMDPLSWEGDSRIRGATCTTKEELAAATLEYVRNALAKLEKL